MNFNWPDDSLFNNWISDIAQEKQLISEETDEDGVDPNELQIIDAEEERKEEQLTLEKKRQLVKLMI